MIYSFSPISNKQSKVLILGSIPGKESLRKGQYYGHDRNGFWRVIYGLFSEVYEPDYALRTQFLLQKGIALWDVIKCCEREGSLDSNIRNPIINDFGSFFRGHIGIKHVFFNGRMAYHLFKKHVGFAFEGILFTYLKSTSPAHAVAFETRLKEWRTVRAALNEIEEANDGDV
ncbi:MAG: DNA-deoxyinosine glycosylase [Christensenellales bacterium]|jgi:hypoxanthine-DNA glycosylase